VTQSAADSAASTLALSVLGVVQTPTAPGDSPVRVGGALLIAEDLAVTSAHVVSAALGLPAGTQPPWDVGLSVALPDPAAGFAPVTIEAWGPATGSASPLADLALLRLTRPLAGARPAVLLPAPLDHLAGHRVWVLAAPERGAAGGWHSGRLRPAPGGLVQVAWDGQPAPGGLSGAPAWDEASGGVLGLLSMPPAGLAASQLVPAAEILRGWPNLRAMAPRTATAPAAYFDSHEGSTVLATPSNAPTWQPPPMPPAPPPAAPPPAALPSAAGPAAPVLPSFEQLTRSAQGTPSDRDWAAPSDRDAPDLGPTPFPGLASFTDGDSDVFFGRDQEAGELAATLEGHRWTTVLGPSGCGKSSLVMAGVLPRRRDAGDLVITLVPGRPVRPLAALATRLAALLDPARDPASAAAVIMGELLASGLRGLAPRVLAATGAPRLLIVIDQLEELLTLDPAAADELAAALALEAMPPSVSVLATLRADFLGRVLERPALAALVSTAGSDRAQVASRLHTVSPMTRAQLHEVVTRPIEDIPDVDYEPGLADRVLRDAGGAQGALPLLAYALAQLWERQRGGLLTHQAYEGLGGVTGALAGAAAAAWDAIPEASRPAAGRLLTSLVRVGDAGEPPASRTATRAEVGEESWAVAIALASAKLLVLDAPRGADGAMVETARLAHDSLTTEWAALREQIAADREFLAWRESLRHDLTRWEAADRRGRRELLPSRTTLEAGAPWADRLAPGEQEYVAQGRAWHRRRRLIAISSLTAAFILLAAALTGGGVAIVANNNAAANAAITRANTLANDAAVLQSTDPGLAAQLAVAAYRTSPTQSAASQLYSSLTGPLNQTVATTKADILDMETQVGGPLAAAIGDDGTLRVWNDSGAGKPVLESTTRGLLTEGIALAPGKPELAGGCLGHGLCVWNVANPQHPVASAPLPLPPVLQAKGLKIDSMAFSGDGTLLAGASIAADVTVVWSLTAPGGPKVLTTLPNPAAAGTSTVLSGVAFSPAGHLLAETTLGGTAQLWNLDASQPAGKVLSMGDGTSDAYQAITFSPDGRLIAAAGSDGDVGLWVVTNPAHPAALRNFGSTPALGTATHVSFSADSTTLYTGGIGSDNTQSALCEMGTSRAGVVAALGANGTELEADCTTTSFDTFNVATTPAGKVLTGSTDGTVRLWSQSQPVISDVSVLAQDGLSVSPSGLIAVPIAPSAASVRPTLVGIWSLTASGPVRLATIKAGGPLQDVRFVGANGLMIVTESSDSGGPPPYGGPVTLWSLRDPRKPARAASLGDAQFSLFPGSNAESSFVASAGVSSDEAGDIVGVQGNGDLVLWRVSASLAAQQVGTLPVPSYNDEAFVSSDSSVVISTGTGLSWWDITNPASPRAGTTVPFPKANAGDLVGSHGVIAGTEGLSDTGTSLKVVGASAGKVTGSATIPGTVGTAVGLSSDGRLLAISSSADNAFRLYDISHPGHPVAEGLGSGLQSYQGFTFDSAGGLLSDWTSDSDSSDSDANEVQLWDTSSLASPELRATIKPPAAAASSGGVSDTEYLPHGVLAIAYDDAIAFYDTSPTALAASLCAGTGATITPAEWSQDAPGIPYDNACAQS
jgi:WD40 repeat protein